MFAGFCATSLLFLETINTLCSCTSPWNSTIYVECVDSQSSAIHCALLIALQGFHDVVDGQ
jgi:hypothetical protein